MEKRLGRDQTLKRMRVGRSSFHRTCHFSVRLTVIMRWKVIVSFFRKYVLYEDAMACEVVAHSGSDDDYAPGLCVPFQSLWKDGITQQGVFSLFQDGMESLQTSGLPNFVLQESFRSEPATHGRRYGQWHELSHFQLSQMLLKVWPRCALI